MIGFQRQDIVCRSEIHATVYHLFFIYNSIDRCVTSNGGIHTIRDTHRVIFHTLNIVCRNACKHA
jgi:hypothetical protein